jgi:hypothetical protein
MPASRATAIALSFLLLASCASLNYPVNTPLPGGHDAALSSIPDVGGDTAIGLSFSGGGTRAAAFARRIVFVVVNAGQGPTGNWSRTLEGPSGADLVDAVTDTAINSAVRSGFDAFRLSMHEWENAIRKWRCALSSAEAHRLGARTDWRCSNITFEVTEVSFDRLDPPTAAKLSAIRTRFKLPVEEVDLLIQSGADEILSDPIFSRGTAGRR